jgi:hypothetical protein
MPSFKRQTERKVSAQAVIRKIKTFFSFDSFAICFAHTAQSTSFPCHRLKLIFSEDWSTAAISTRQRHQLDQTETQRTPKINKQLFC